MLLVSTDKLENNVEGLIVKVIVFTLIDELDARFETFEMVLVGSVICRVVARCVVVLGLVELDAKVSSADNDVLVKLELTVEVVEKVVIVI